MTTSPNVLPPLPKPPSAPATETIELTLPCDLFADLKTAAKEQGMDLDTAVAMCVARWRYPAQPEVISTRKPRAKRA